MRENLPCKIQVSFLIGMAIVCTVSQSKFFSKENMRENLPHQIKVLLFIGLAMVCLESQA